MTIFSKQKFYCATCGSEIKSISRGIFWTPVCGPECLDEFQWRNTLSICGEEYKERPSEINPSHWCGQCQEIRPEKHKCYRRCRGNGCWIPLRHNDESIWYCDDCSDRIRD
jgi:hypothetical protein